MIELVAPAGLMSTLGGDLPLFVSMTLNFMPEPGTLLLVGSGIAGLAAVGRGAVTPNEHPQTHRNAPAHSRSGRRRLAAQYSQAARRTACFRLRRSRWVADRRSRPVLHTRVGGVSPWEHRAPRAPARGCAAHRSLGEALGSTPAIAAPGMDSSFTVHLPPELAARSRAPHDRGSGDHHHCTSRPRPCGPRTEGGSGHNRLQQPHALRPVDTSDRLDSDSGKSSIEPYREENRNRCPVRSVCPARRAPGP